MKIRLDECPHCHARATDLTVAGEPLLHIDHAGRAQYVVHCRHCDAFSPPGRTAKQAAMYHNGGHPNYDRVRAQSEAGQATRIKRAAEWEATKERIRAAHERVTAQHAGELSPTASPEPPSPVMQEKDSTATDVKNAMVDVKYALIVRRFPKEMTPQQAIAANCLECYGTFSRVQECEHDPDSVDPCAVWPYRLYTGKPAGRTVALRAIRRACLWCMKHNLWYEKNGPASISQRIQHCPYKDCPLWPYRFGYQPPKKGA